MAKEKIILFLVALGFVTIRLAFALVLLRDWRVFVGVLLSSGLIIAILRSKARAGWKPSYPHTEGLTMIELVATVSGLGAAMALAMWMKP